MRRESNIPERYQAITAIQTNYASVIDTQQPLNGNVCKIELDYKLTKINGNTALFGTSDNNLNFAIVPYLGGNTTIRLALGSTNPAYTTTILMNERRTFSFEINKNAHTYTANNNGTVSNGSWSGTVSTNNMILFGMGYGGSFVNHTIFQCLCYGASITIDGTVVRNYVPMSDIVTGQVGLYDLCGTICDITGTPLYVAANIFTVGE